jgi:hypothetical protein
LTALAQNSFHRFHGQTFDGASSGSLRHMQVFSPSLDFANPELDMPK